MDLIYANANKEDLGVFKNYTFDLAYGSDENDFELTTDLSNNICESGYLLYIEGTEYGGIINRIRIETKDNTLIYYGNTWHGILSKKILQPDAGDDYLICNGEANEVLGTLITRMGASDLFSASTDDSDITISNYKMNRYIDGYNGIRKMLASANAKLIMTYENSKVQLKAVPIKDYSTNEDFDSSQFEFTVEKDYKPINHVICLGRGELAEREVIHLYADEEGNISSTQTYTGMDEITEVYDNSNCESLEELENGGRELLKTAYNSDTLEINFDSTQNYDIGDIVGARENVTGIFITKPIIKKIVSIENGKTQIEHKI